MKAVRELQVVRLKVPVGVVPAGAEGTVVDVHGDGRFATVEFIDGTGNTIGVEDVEACGLDLVHDWPDSGGR